MHRMRKIVFVNGHTKECLHVFLLPVELKEANKTKFRLGSLYYEAGGEDVLAQDFLLGPDDRYQFWNLLLF